MRFIIHDNSNPTYFEVSTKHADCSFWDVVLLEETNVDRPNSSVLCNWKSSERSVKNLTGSGDFALIHNELAEVHPNARHLKNNKNP